jgi:type IV pilus assembly protein PilZ
MSRNARQDTGRESGDPTVVLQLVIKEKAALYAAYMSFVEGGGLFVPTGRPVVLGDRVELLVQLPGDQAPSTVTGKVVWLTPAGTPGRQQGLGIQLPKDEAGARLRDRIHALLGTAAKAGGPTNTI